MKKFYVILLVVSVTFFAMLYFSIWWLLAGVAAIAVFLAYRFYAGHLALAHAKKEELEQEVLELQDQLDRSIMKEQKTNKKAEQVKASNQNLLKVISHEVRTPINGIMGMTMLLADTPLNDEQKDHISTIRNCCESLLAKVSDVLADDILNFSKLDREAEKTETGGFDIRDCVEEVISLFAGKTGKAGMELMYSIDPEIPAKIAADHKSLRQVLMNLVENAVKFTSEGEIAVNIQSTTSGTGKPQLSFEVRDTGAGLAKEQLRQIFMGIPGKDVQEEEEQGASGLGLVICRKLVEQMDGQINVKSQPGKGSIFTFTIPFVPVTGSIHNIADQGKMAAFENKRILIVDDNASYRDILADLLKSWKIQATAAESGKQALDVLSQDKNFDIVLTDLNMPDMNGGHLAKSIKKQYPGVPVILMKPAGDELAEYDQEAISAVLIKPVRQNLLRDQLINVFANRTVGGQNTTNTLSDNFAKQYPLRILLAEDNAVNQKLAIKILHKLGYEPALAKNGKEALEIVSNENFDIILMDVQMPEMDGLEATRMIRACLAVQPVIVAVTANVMMGDREECM
ncbi:MAG: response regulator, partial [Chitinophagaceae bacterium]|nr:response regulator [Chitinophagaceae bacterium]